MRGGGPGGAAAAAADFNEWAGQMLAGMGGGMNPEMQEMLHQIQMMEALGGNGVGDGMLEDFGNLDPNLPLMQLFLQTLLPWNNVRRQG